MKHNVEYGKDPDDFKIDGKYTFEIGGRDKSFDQITDMHDSHILADQIEYPIGKKPLYGSSG